MSTDLMTYAPDRAAPAANRDMLMELDLCVHTPENIFIFHDIPFSKPLSWLEYDVGDGRLDFIMEDGDLRNFGIAVEKSVGAYLQNHHEICVVLRDGIDVVSDVVVPLIIQEY